MVDVQQRALRAFEQDVLALAQRVVEQLGGLCHVRLQDASVRQVLFADLFDRVGVQAVNLLQDRILLGQRRLHLQTEDLFVHEILDADTATGCFVLVARTDAALRGADLVVAQALFVRTVQILVVRHDDVGVAGNLQALAGDAFGLQHGHFLHEHARVDDHAVADDRHGGVVHDAGRHEMQRELFVAMDDGVPSVVASLIAHDVVVIARDEVRDLTFALVAPLGADQNGGWHTGPFVGFWHGREDRRVARGLPSASVRSRTARDRTKRPARHARQAANRLASR